MKIKTLILALGLLAPVAFTTSCNSPYYGLVNRQENGLVTLTNTLSNVHDKASADAAVPAVRTYGGLLMGDIMSLCNNGRPSMLELLMLKSSYENSNIKAQSKSCLAQIFRLASCNFYGSTELRSAVITMFTSGQ